MASNEIEVEFVVAHTEQISKAFNRMFPEGDGKALAQTFLETLKQIAGAES